MLLKLEGGIGYDDVLVESAKVPPVHLWKIFALDFYKCHHKNDAYQGHIEESSILKIDV